MSGSDQQQAYVEAERANKSRMQQAYGIALPALGTEYGALNQALQTAGEPGYIKSAYGAARGGAREDLALAGNEALKASYAKQRGTTQGGANLNPTLLGSQMAQALYGPRVQEAAGQLEQMNKLFGASIGQAQQTGSGALAATGNELANIGNMRNYNATYANVLGALNAGASIYGAYGQQGNPYASAIRPGGTSGSSNWQGFSPGVGFS